MEQVEANLKLDQKSTTSWTSTSPITDSKSQVPSF